jgi:hypothetical protein
MRNPVVVYSLVSWLGLFGVAAGAEPLPAREPIAPPTLVTSEAAAAAPSTADAARDRGQVELGVGMSLLAAGGVSFGVGIYEWVRLIGTAFGGLLACDDKGRALGECDRLQRDVNSIDKAMVPALAVGAAATLVSIPLVVLGSRDLRRSRVALRTLPAPGAAGLQLSMRF